MSEEGGALTLKRAAERLGVHEQMLRSWERNGIIRMIRLPGSGYRRVPVTEVDRLKCEMERGNAKPAVWLEAPDESPEAVMRGQVLAATIRTELTGVEEDGSFDEFLASRRGRA